jgi:predicted transcriptional regulator of viral defense system
MILRVSDVGRLEVLLILSIENTIDNINNLYYLSIISSLCYNLLMNIYQLSKQIPLSVVTHDQIEAILSPYVNNINAKISYMVKKGELLRLKKGVYVFGEECRINSIDMISIANTLYAPSYVSFEYALSYYGLIPERVYEITSATMRMKKEFPTPVGRFTYKVVPLQAYALGVDWSYDKTYGGKLIATAEKALCDKIKSDRGIGRLSQAKLEMYLEHDLRIDMDLLFDLDSGLIEAIARAYRSSNLHNLAKFINKRKQSA